MARASTKKPAATDQEPKKENVGPVSAGLKRLDPLTGRYASGPGVTLLPVAPRFRLALRCHEKAIDPVGKALGLALPTRPKTSATGEGLSALWLGPDEWLIVGAEGAGGTPAERLDALSNDLVSAVDISHRNAGISVEGPAAEAVIAAGCPQDVRLQAFPAGAASRTVLGKAEIVLWRRSELRFEVECWRSFADYVWRYLEEAAREPMV